MITWEKLMEYHRDMIEWMLANLHAEFIQSGCKDMYDAEREWAQRNAQFIPLVEQYGFIRIGCIIDDILIKAEYQNMGKLLSCCGRCPFFKGEDRCQYQNSLYGTLREEGIKGPNAERVMKSILELKPREDIKDLYKLYIEY